MSTQSDAIPQSPLQAQVIAPAEISETQRLYWSLRRELWENRSIYIAPLAVAALYLVGFLVSMVHYPEKIRAAMALSPEQQRGIIEQPYTMAALLIMGSTIIVAVFYSLDALHGERRDRSILFWKSLPVSDVTTVVSKASIPLLVLPLISVAVTIVTYWVMLLLSSAVLTGSGVGGATLWSNLPLFRISLTLFFHLVGIHGLWYAPFYGYLLLVSAWARRAPFLWALLPPFAIAIVEKIAFNTSYFATMLQTRFMGGPEDVASPGGTAMESMTHLAPNFLISPGLWIGLVIFAGFLVAAVRVRRYQGPI